MRTFSGVLSSVLVAAALTCAGSARADDPPRGSTPTNAEMVEAEARFEEGLNLYEKGNINEARLKLVQAYAVLGRPNILWNLSVAEFYSSRTLDSIRHMRRFLKSPDANPRDVQVAREKFIPALEKITGRISVVAPNGYSITVDGEPAGVSPLAESVDVLPGRHAVVAVGPTGSTTAQVDVLAGQAVTSTLNTGATPTAASSESKATTAREPGAEAPSPFARNVTMIGLGGAAVASAVVGVVFAVKAGSDDDDAASIRSRISGGTGACLGPGASPDCARLQSASDDHVHDRGISTGFFIGAGVLAVGAIVTYLVWPKAGSARAGLDGSRARLGFSF
jgi:hypothetical protein